MFSSVNIKSISENQRFKICFFFLLTDLHESKWLKTKRFFFFFNTISVYRFKEALHVTRLNGSSAIYSRIQYATEYYRVVRDWENRWTSSLQRQPRRVAKKTETVSLWDEFLCVKKRNTYTHEIGWKNYILPTRSVRCNVLQLVDMHSIYVCVATKRPRIGFCV